MKKTALLMITAAAVILTVCCGNGKLVLASEANKDIKTVRVAYPAQKGLTEVDEEGNYVGYTYEYLQAIAQYTGWQYEFVQAEGTEDEQLSAMLEMLQNGEVDLMSGIIYTDELGKEFDYAAQSYGTGETVLQTITEEAGKIRIDTYNEQKLRIAVLNDKGRSIEELEAYCRMNTITPEYVLCGNAEEQVRAIEEKRADVMLNSSMNAVAGVSTVAEFAPKPFYFVTAEGKNRELLQELNEALVNISDSNPYMQDTLYEKYFVPAETNLNFSPEETAYLKQKGTVRIGALDEQPPYLYEENVGEKGVLFDLADILSEKMGVPVEIVRETEVDVLYQMAENGQIDLIAGIPYNYEYAEHSGIVVTQPYLNSQYVMVYKRNPEQMKDGRLALLNEGAYKRFAPENAVYYDTIADCVKAVMDNRADCSYMESYTAQYYVNSPEFWGLKQSILPYRQLQICFGMVQPMDKMLHNIVNKTVLTISKEQQQKMITDNMMQGYKLSFVYYIRQYPLEVFGGCVLVFAILFALIYQRLRANRRVVLEMKKQSQVYEILDDNFFEYDYGKHELKIRNPLEDGNDAKMKIHHYEDDLTEDMPGREFLNMIWSKQDGEFEIYDNCVGGQKHWLRGIAKTIYNSAGKAVYTIGKVKIVDDEKKKWEKLVEQVQIDELTGLYNIRTFRKMTEEALAQMEENQQGALLLMDLDHFKEINDVYGHLEGDKALKWMAKTAKKYFEEEGVTGRYGGDEFIVYIPEITGSALLEGQCASFCRTVRQRTETEAARMTVSIGIAFSHKGDRYDEIFQTADEALYKVKGDGKDGFWMQDHNNFIQNAKLYDVANRCTVKAEWLDDEQYQTILKNNHMVAFEYDVEKKVQKVSPFISEYVSGNYDGRMLSQVMVEDDIIYPEDIDVSLQFREMARKGESGEMTLRLLTPEGTYKWFRMSLTMCNKENQKLMIGILADVDTQVRQREELQSREKYDLVSGIYNKDTFFEKTQEVLKDYAEDTHYFIRFDIDRFKMINELFSITDGNKVLRYIGELLRELAKPGETYARLENDIFCMCVDRTQDETISLVNELTEKIKNYPLAFNFSVSTGIVRIEPYCCSPIYALSDRAAIAQRKIKGSYLHHFTFYDSSMGKQLSREHDILMSMEAALSDNAFLAFFQPKYDVRDNRIIGAEALARWSHPTLGNVSPGEFIPLFEQNGFIVKLDEYIWEYTCRAIKDWIQKGIKVVPISVNVSRVHLYDEEFCDKISSLCEQYEIPPELLELEITESAYVEQPQALYNIMDRLQKRGFTFSMDDFGSGYSSLNALKDIPVNVVKIDLHFLEKARRGEEAGRGILKDTIQLMNNLNLAVIAEGVETQEQVNYLQSIGCVYAQGYYYSKPVQLKEFEKMLREQ